jgi:hypothetical protein
MNKIDLKHLASYDDDFALWSAEQAALIRAQKFDRVDLENVAEEIESLGRSAKAEIVSRMRIILIHLLKWQFQPDKAPNNSWAASILEGRQEIADAIAESPSLRAYPATVLERAYRNAPRSAAGDTGLPLKTFPSRCPYDVEQVLDEAFWPGKQPE